MQEYIDRLVRCGYSTYEAYVTCMDFVKNMSWSDLDQFVKSVENNTYVDSI